MKVFKNEILLFLLNVLYNVGCIDAETTIEAGVGNYNYGGGSTQGTASASTPTSLINNHPVSQSDFHNDFGPSNVSNTSPQAFINNNTNLDAQMLENKENETKRANNTLSNLVGTPESPALNTFAKDTNEEFKNSVYYLPPFDPKVNSMPLMQREYVKKVMKDNLNFMRQIISEAIDKKDTFAASFKLMLKYSTKLLGLLIQTIKDGMLLRNHISYSSNFYKMLAEIYEKSVDLSDILKREKKYTTKSVDTVSLYKRVDSAFKWIENTTNLSPVADYLRWNETILFKNDPTNPNRNKNLIDECADIYAQFRGMGYESTSFVARKIINVFKMFSRNLSPSLKDV